MTLYNWVRGERQLFVYFTNLRILGDCFDWRGAVWNDLVMRKNSSRKAVLFGAVLNLLGVTEMSYTETMNFFLT